MKRVVSIFFLILFLFNAGGYYALYWICSYHAEQKMISRIDAETITTKEEITLAIPLSLPYVLDASQNFERMKGDFEYEGEHFKFVKQKLQGDTLYVVCIKNVQQKKIENAINDYTAKANDTSSQSKQALNLLSKLFKEFQPEAALTLNAPIEINIILPQPEKSAAIQSRSTSILSPPPEA